MATERRTNKQNIIFSTFQTRGYRYQNYVKHVTRIRTTIDMWWWYDHQIILLQLMNSCRYCGTYTVKKIQNKLKRYW